MRVKYTRVVSAYLEIRDETLRTSSHCGLAEGERKWLYFPESLLEKHEWMLNKFRLFNLLCKKGKKKLEIQGPYNSMKYNRNNLSFLNK